MNTDIDLSSLDNFDLSPEWESEQKKFDQLQKTRILNQKKTKQEKTER